MNVRLTNDMPAALRHLQRAVPFDTEGRTSGDVFERLHGAAVFDLVEGDRAIGAFALTIEGENVRCLAAGADAGFVDLVTVMVEFAEREARERIGARRLQCETVRPGLIKRLQRHGFRISGYILTKELS